ncbi:MAG: hypothetical protein HY291_18545 [Planctomycetes bacterium]|nr:hypothetical protein [Planctomycetota bacterium]
MAENANAKPAIGIGAAVNHPMFGHGKVVDYEGGNYVVLFKGGEAKRVAFTFEAMKAEGPAGDIEYERIKRAVREVIGDYGWIEIEAELAGRWTGGALRMLPGKEGVQPKDVPIEAFFKKIIGIRDKLRVLEQKINTHPQLSPEEKVEFEGYITRCYGSLTTFNVLFASKEGQFKGTGKEE